MATEFIGGNELAAGDSGHIRDDTLDLVDTVFLQPLLDRFHACYSPARARQAAPNARKIASETGFSRTRHSGCHCTASANAGASSTRNASTSPSLATASMPSP